MKVPCQGCEKRTPTCHTSCEAYLEFRAESNAIREQHMNGYGLRAMLAEREARNAKRAAMQAKKRRALRRG